MSLTAGKVALVNSTSALSGACPTGAQIQDLVGFGGANCFEGAASSAAPASGANANGVIRKQSGCADVNDNFQDFTVGVAVPRNSATTAAVCACTVLNESGVAAEADYCTTQSPTVLSVQTGVSSGLIYGQVFETGLTDSAGQKPTIRAQLGYGLPSANPEYQSGWTWFNAAFNVEAGSNDEYQASFTAPAVGSYRYVYRFSLDDGVSWTYCDDNLAPDFGAGSNAGLSFELGQQAVMTVNP